MVNDKKEKWRKKQSRVRRKVKGTPERPRLCVSKSNRYLSVQVIDDLNAVTLVSAHSKEPSVAKKKSIDGAKELGGLIGARAKEQKIEKVVFDRNGYLYHGRVKAIADAAREAGLQF